MKRTFTLLLLCLTFGSVSAQQGWTLNDCMRYAVENNPQTKRQEILLDDAKNEQLRSKMDLLPSISGSTSASTSFGRSIDPVTNTYSNTSYFSNNYSVSGSMYLFNGLQGINAIRMAKFSRLKQESDSKRVDDLIALQTMQAFFQYTFNDGTLRIAREKLEESAKLLRKCEEEYALGIKSIADLTQAQSVVAADEYRVISCEGEVEKSMITLKNKMYFPLTDTLVLTPSSSFDPMGGQESVDAREVFLRAISFLPEIKMAQMDIKNAKLQWNSAKGSYFPRLSLSGGLSTGYSKNLTDSPDGTESYGDQLRNRLGENVGVTLSVPIFNSLQTRTTVWKAKNAYKTRIIDYEEKLREIEGTVIEAVIDVETAGKEFYQAEKSVVASQMSYDIISVKYTEGLASIIDLQTIQKQLAEAKIAKLNAILSYLIKMKVVKYYQGEPYIN